MTTWLWIGIVLCAALALLWWLDRAPGRHENVPWSEVSDLLGRLFTEMKVGAWADVAPRESEWLVRLERRRGWRKLLFFDVSTPSRYRSILHGFCDERGLLARERNRRTVRIRVLRRDAAKTAEELIERVLVEAGVAPGAALDVRCWGKPSPQALRPIWAAMARRTPIRRGGNLYRGKLRELDKRLERGDD